MHSVPALLLRVGFDLDGVLDRPYMAGLLHVLLEAGVQVHIITGVFDEAGSWQREEEKKLKLARLGIPFREWWAGMEAQKESSLSGRALVHFLHAVGPEFPLEYRLRDLGLRKGALCHQLGVGIFFDDSATYCEVMKAMNGGLTVGRIQ